MKYLDEQIQTIVNFSTITIDESGLYRYDLIDDIADAPLFVGNCYIEKGAKSRTIDITDLVRSIMRYDANCDFQQGFIVRIWNKAQTTFNASAQVTVLPIYRYPNRKSRLETPLKETEEDWYIPSLQGYNSDKEAELLPHIPFVSTEKVNFDLLVNYGTLGGQLKKDLKLFTGVEKELNINNNSLTHTSYPLKNLFSASKEAETIAWDYEQDNLFYNFYAEMMPVKDNVDDNCAKYITSLAPLQYKLTTYKQIDFIEYGDDIGSTQYTISKYPFDATLKVNNVQNYFDLYLNGNDGSFVNVYPSVTINCNATVHITGEYNPNTYIDLITNTTAGEISSSYILEKDTVGVDTFKIEIGKTQASGDIPDKTFENLTVGDIIEFDDTGDHQWLKLYDSTGALIDTLTFNSDVMEDGSWKEYAIKLEEMDTYLALFPLQQVYDFTLDYRAFSKPESSAQNDTMGIRIPSSNYNTVYFDSTTCKVDALQGTGIVSHPAVNLWTTSFTYSSVSSFGTSFVNIYAITHTGEVLYFNGSPTTPFRFTPPTQIRGLYIICMVRINDELYIEQCVFAPLDNRKYFGGFYYNIRGTVSSTGVATSLIDFRFPYYTSRPPYKITPIASIDYCPSKYYLQWRDRYGSMQMQPFNKIDTYSEGFSRNETKDYRNNRSLANIAVQPKWKLNTGWLNDKVYPYYESIFVSPYLKLYDTQEDKAYDVMVTASDYTEKTFTNQSKQLFNLQLDVELNNTQNILY